MKRLTRIHPLICWALALAFAAGAEKPKAEPVPSPSPARTPDAFERTVKGAAKDVEKGLNNAMDEMEKGVKKVLK